MIDVCLDISFVDHLRIGRLDPRQDRIAILVLDHERAREVCRGLIHKRNNTLGRMLVGATIRTRGAEQDPDRGYELVWCGNRVLVDPAP
ncbi:hypothetical protein NHQ30_011339 [Ciborinia camelliae]|nr:hypothetical protein NHQ30_011339 [Ciborinia camelliae]